MVSGKLLVRAAIQTTIWLAFMAVLLFVSDRQLAMAGRMGVYCYLRGRICSDIRVAVAARSGAAGCATGPTYATWSSRLGQNLSGCVHLPVVRLAGVHGTGRATLADVASSGLAGSDWRHPDRYRICSGGARICRQYFRSACGAHPERAQPARHRYRAVCACAASHVRGGLTYLVGMPLLLGSWYGLIGTVIFAMGISARAVQEERKLQRELPGYADYITRVRYRLIPGIW